MKVLAIDPGTEQSGWVRVVVPGPPCAQGRPRAFNSPRGIRLYDPAKSRSWKGAAQVHMAEVMCGRPPFEGPLRVEILAVFACPTTEHRKTNPRERRWHTKANGDAENIAKAVLDAGSGVVWCDDRQVSQLVIEKLIGAQGEAPGVTLWCRVITEEPNT